MGEDSGVGEDGCDFSFAFAAYMYRAYVCVRSTFLCIRHQWNKRKCF